MVSRPPEASVMPLGENEETEPGLNVAIFSLVSTSHSLTVPSYPPPAEASVVPSEENTTEYTEPVCLNVAIFSLVAIFHSLIVPSSAPEASICHWEKMIQK